MKKRLLRLLDAEIQPLLKPYRTFAEQRGFTPAYPEAVAAAEAKSLAYRNQRLEDLIAIRAIVADWAPPPRARKGK